LSATHPFLDAGGPVAIAHRGGADHAPENTLPAFQAAIELGYRPLETDVHLTRDGVVVAFHDPRLDRVTDSTGAIEDLDVDAVEAADAGYGFTPDGGRSFPFRGQGVRVPRMDELLRRWPEAHINIDPKSNAVVDPLVDLLDRHDAWDRVCLGSFSDARLRKVRSLRGERACTSMGPLAVAVARTASLAGVMPRQGAACVQVPRRQGPLLIVTDRFVRAAHRAGLPVHVWTINDEAEMHALLDLGVDGVMTDRLELLLRVFESRGLRVDGAEGIA
jgi:glycerophosphoryl diester phosphodiesterase